jgi:ElaB/YqjD/DUF883 family membrane-anchored ribosome-binding protein
MENEDVIRQQMEETRTSLTEKVEILEQKLANSVTETADAFTETVANVTDTVQETVANVKESMEEGVETVKSWFDLGAQVDQHPWAMVAGSMAAGFMLGTFIPEKESAKPTSTPLPEPGPSRKTAHHHNGGTARRSQPERQPSPSWLSQFEPELNQLKGLALGAALGTLREMITGSLSSEMGQRLGEIVDTATRKLGGEPLPSSAFTQPTSSEEETQPSEQPTDSGKSHQGKKKHHERFKMQ